MVKEEIQVHKIPDTVEDLIEILEGYPKNLYVAMHGDKNEYHGISVMRDPEYDIVIIQQY